jgi:hypothetical protein
MFTPNSAGRNIFLSEGKWYARRYPAVKWGVAITGKGSRYPGGRKDQFPYECTKRPWSSRFDAAALNWIEVEENCSVHGYRLGALVGRVVIYLRTRHREALGSGEFIAVAMILSLAAAVAGAMTGRKQAATQLEDLLPSGGRLR